MSRKQNAPLRALTDWEREQLEHISRTQSWPAVQVSRAKVLLSVSAGCSYIEAARTTGRKSGPAVSHLVSRFNIEGIAALVPVHAGGPAPRYNPEERAYVLSQARRQPDREADGTATWSLTCLQRAVRQQLPAISTYTIWCILHEAGLSWQKSRTWCETGQVQRLRKRGIVTVIDPDAEAKKKLIEEAYRYGEQLGLLVCNEDEAGPFQCIPQAGPSWQPEEHAVRRPHEYIRGGTAKLLTLFHPADGQVHLQGVTSSSNAVLHPWLQQELTEILMGFPLAKEEIGVFSEEEIKERHQQWSHWQEGLQVKFTLTSELPPLRMLLILDNLAGHKTASFVCWMMKHGIMPLYTPLGGSWLNMAESIQRILVRRALAGQYPKEPEEIIAWLEATARAWNREPTPFVWGGARQTRRERAYQRRHPLGGSSACTQATTWHFTTHFRKEKSKRYDRAK